MANSSVNKVPIGKTKIFDLVQNVETTLVFPKFIQSAEIFNIADSTIYMRSDNELAVIDDNDSSIISSSLGIKKIYKRSIFNEISFITAVENTKIEIGEWW